MNSSKMNHWSPSSIIVVLILCMITLSFCADEDQEYIKIQSELELIEWDLQDECSHMAKNEKNFLLQHITGLRDKIKGEVDHANFLRTHSQRLKQYEDVPYDMQRNWTYYTKCGDILLSRDEYKVLVIFANKNLDLKLKDEIVIIEKLNSSASKNSTESSIVPIDTDEKRRLKESDVLYALATCRKSSELKDIWNKWEFGINTFKEWYANALDLTSKAANANECANVETYWEMLTEMPGGYEVSRNLFESIQPLYKKLLNFVRLRINKYYNTTYEEYIPVHLTGSFMADDFTNIADILLPHPQLYYNIKVELEARDITDFYKYAGNATKNLGFGDLVNSDFVKRSSFNDPNCHPRILNYCAEQFSSVLTCNRTSLTNYYDAFEAVMQMGLTKANFHAHVRQTLRSSPVLEGMSALLSLMSINAMLQNKILEKDVFIDEERREENRMTVMLILALKVLPKIAYYHMMDEFRIELLEHQGLPEAVFQEKRKLIQGIFTEDGQTSEYLRDEDVLYNRPYLNKMLGQFLQFQLINYYQIDLFEDGDISTFFNKDSTFRDFVLSIPNKEPEELLSYYYNIDKISEYPLASFFSPLEEYLDNAPLDQEPFTIKKATYVKPEPTTESPPPPPKTRPKMKTTPAVRAAVSHVDVKPVNDTKLVITDIKANDTKISGKIDGKDNYTSYNDSSAIAAAHIGIYIGSALVLVTLAIIAAGFIVQRRRTHRNQRRYNA